MKSKAPVEEARQNRNMKIYGSIHLIVYIGKIFLKLVRKHFPMSHKFNLLQLTAQREEFN